MWQRGSMINEPQIWAKIATAIYVYMHSGGGGQRLPVWGLIEHDSPIRGDTVGAAR